MVAFLVSTLWVGIGYGAEKRPKAITAQKDVPACQVKGKKAEPCVDGAGRIWPEQGVKRYVF